DRVSGLSENAQRCLECRLVRGLVRPAGAADISLLSRQNSSMRRSHRLYCVDQRRVYIALAPVHLIDGPRRNRRFAKSSDFGAVLSSRRRQRISRVGEFVQRKLVQTVDLHVEGWHAVHHTRQGAMGDRENRVAVSATRRPLAHKEFTKRSKFRRRSNVCQCTPREPARIGAKLWRVNYVEILHLADADRA